MFKNKLYYGDNLDILRRYIPDDSVDLIYLDPPFNSQATYNVLFKEKNGTASVAQIKAFEDTWHWDSSSEKTYWEIVEKGPKKLADLIQAMRAFLGTNDMMAYLVMMAIRLVEMQRVLKPIGSIYLHCDPTASHYLKLVMDAVFGSQNFRNEIIWYYKTGGVSKRWFGRKHDVIFFYSKTSQYQFYPQKEKSYLTHRYGFSNVEIFEDEGGPYTIVGARDVWDVPALRGNQPETLGYPTQKPEALLERIISANSNEGDIVLDPFCGCGTTLVVAERLHRHWIGIDITHLAIALMRHRLEDTFGPDLSLYEVIGEPVDLRGAQELANQDRYQFQWWALGLVAARPAESEKKKGADTGIDGYIYFHDDESGQTKKIILQVKSGTVSVSHIRDLIGTLEREKANLGVFITLEEPTQKMRTEAASAGFYKHPLREQKYSKIQILTIEQLLNGSQIDYPGRAGPDASIDATFKKAQRKSKLKIEQQKML